MISRPVIIIATGRTDLALNYPLYVELAREFRLYKDFWYSDGSITARELLCVEVVDNVCTGAYMQFDFI